MDIVTEEVREEQSAEIGDDEPMYDGETKQSILNTSDTTGSKKALSITENSDARMDDAISEAESDDDIEDPLDNAAPNQQDDEDEEECRYLREPELSCCVSHDFLCQDTAAPMVLGFVSRTVFFGFSCVT
eukprot:m.544018 g.544018  ORF g.544018 m.544018 type:complete len:130 (+) comp22134_c0_seq5:131-520(+)